MKEIWQTFWRINFKILGMKRVKILIQHQIQFLQERVKVQQEINHFVLLKILLP